MVPCKSNAKEGSFEWSHHRILSTDSKVRTTLHVSIIDSGSEMVDLAVFYQNQTSLAAYHVYLIPSSVTIQTKEIIEEFFSRCFFFQYFANR